MSQNVVLDSQGDFPESSSNPLAAAVPAVSIDPVPVLAEACWRQIALLQPALPQKRPFDAQYWACWVVAVLFPVLVAYLFWTR